MQNATTPPVMWLPEPAVTLCRPLILQRRGLSVTTLRLSQSRGELKWGRFSVRSDRNDGGQGMTTTIKQMLNALATLLGANAYNDYLDAQQPVPVPVRQQPPKHQKHR